MAKNLSNMCPSGPEWNALVNHPNIGLYQAMKDWMDYDGTIRTVDQVLAKLNRSVTPAIKPGVEELFESNPELANAVYESLGFKNDYELKQTDETIEADGLSYTGYDIVYKGENIGSVLLSYGNNTTTVRGIGFHDKYLNKGLGKGFYEWLGDKSDIEGSTLFSDFDNTSVSATRVWESLKKKGLSENIQLGYKYKRKNLKQQALQQYSQYLDTIFPDSKVKSIVYRGVPYRNAGFDKAQLKPNLNAFYFTDNVDEAKYYGSTKRDEDDNVLEYGTLFPVLLNIKNPYNNQLGLIKDLENIEDNEIYYPDLRISTKTVKLLQDNNYDGYITQPEFGEQHNFGQTTDYKYKVVFEPEQIHILGSKQDIEGFKEFVKTEPTSTPVQSQATSDVVEQFRDVYETNGIIPGIKENKETRFINRSLDKIDANIKELNGLWRISQNKKDFWNKLHTDYEIPLEIVIVLKNYTGNTFSDIINQYKDSITEYYRPSTLTGQLLLDESSRPAITTEENKSNNTGLNAVKQLINKLQQQFPGIKVEMVTAGEARTITANTVNPWSNEPAFFFGDTAYFVTDSITEEMAFHEFSHPFVKAILKNNPELFTNLVKELNNTPEGQAIINEVAQLYPELNKDDNRFMEEVIVRAITQHALKTYTNQGSSTGFIKIIKKIMAWVKDKLNELFKIKVSKLDTTTSIEELGKMLAKGKVFDLGPNPMSNDQITDYARRSLNREFDDIMTIPVNDNRQDIVEIATQGYKSLTKTLKVIKDSNDPEEMIKVLSDELGLSNVEEMRKNLSKYTDMMQKRIEVKIEDIDYTTNHVEALVNTYYRLSKTIPKITEHLKQLVKDPNNPNNIQKSFAYGKILEYWESWLNLSLTRMEENKIGSDNAITKLIAGTLEEINRSQKQLAILRGESVKETIYNYFLPLSEAAKERFESTLKTYKKYNYDQRSIDRIYKEYYGLTEAEYNEMLALEKTGNRSMRYDVLKAKSYANGMNINEEKIQLLLEGQLNDVPALSSLIEGYMYQDDPVVGGFSLFVKNAIDSVMVKSQMRYNEFAKDIVPLLEEIGYNPQNVAQLGDKVLFEDSIVFEENGEPVEKKVYTLLNPHKNYRSAITNMEYEIRKAKEQYEKTNSDSDKDKLNALLEKKLKHDIAYMNNEYVPEYYDIRNKFTDYGRDSIAIEALHRRDLILEEIRKEQESQTDDNFFEVNDKLKLLWNKYRMLHSIKDTNGKIKTNETKDGIITNDLAIAQKLIDYRDQTRKFYEYIPKQGAFEAALANYEQKLRLKNIRGDEFKSKRETWIYSNTRIKILPEFFVRRREILKEISEIYARDNRTKKGSEELKDLYKILNDAITGYRDDDGQPDASLMSEGRMTIIRDAELRIEEVRNSMEEINDKNLKKRLNKLWRDFSELSTTEPTDYYVDQMDKFLEEIQLKEIMQKYGTYTISKDNLSDLIDGSDKSVIILSKLKKASPEFAEWFDKNHIRKSYVDESGNETTYYKRTYAWNVIRPKDLSYIEAYDLKDENGEVIEVLDRIPNIRFYERVVKDEYKTGYDPKTGKVNLEIGKDIDNKGNWLPRTDVLDSPYRNEAYYNLKNTDPKTFAVLEKLKEFHLKNQEKADKYTKLYLDLPRFEQERLEIIQNKKKSPEEMGIWQKMITNVKQFFTGSREMPETGYKWEDEFAVSSMEIFENEERNRIPIHGLYNIPIDMTSKNVTNSLLRYMFSIEKNKKLSEIHPTALALKDALLKNDTQKFKDIKIKNLVHQGEFNYRNKDMNERRRKVINNFINREFYGETTIGLGSDNKLLHNLSGGLFQVASFGYFAFNIQSALKNTVGQKLQNLIEAMGMKYYTPVDLVQGKMWAWKMMPQLSANIYSKDPKPLAVQLWETFDPGNMIGQKASKEGLSRTLLSDLINNPVGMSMNFRKWTELHASAELLGAMLNNQKVELNGKPVSLLEAWEVIDGKIQLKEGVDPEWGITYDENGEMIIGKKFLKKKNEIEAVLRNISGAYDSFNQPELNRYVLGKAVSYLKKYMTTITVDRLGFRWKNNQLQARIQPGLGNAVEGFYITTFRYILDIFRSGGKRLTAMTPEERRAFFKTGSDAAMYLMWSAIASFVFGWDDEDEERFAKLREKSGPMRGPFIAESEYEFHMGGWVSNHMLNLVLQVQAEQGQFIPWPGLGLSGYIGIATEGQGQALLGPTLAAAGTAMFDAVNLITNNRYAYYSKDVGPYQWQQEESFKFVNHLVKSIGLTGTFYEPIQGIKSWEYAERTRTTGF